MTTGNEEKRAENEATFRDANEQIRTAVRKLDPPLERVPYLCECDDVRCREPLQLTTAEYERVRSDGATFAVVRGHACEGEAIEENDRYLVVRKPDEGGEVARALDPRREDA